MGMFLDWATEKMLTPVTNMSIAATSEKTSMEEKVEIIGSVDEFRKLVSDYREKAGDNYSMDEDPIFMDVDRFKIRYSSDETYK